MYSKEKIGIELKEKINQKLDYPDISKWALDVYLTDVAVNDAELDTILSILMMMDQGPGFELSHKKLTEIANILIVGDSPIYTRQQCGKELKNKIQQKVDVTDIGKWAYRMYSEHMCDIDDDFQEFLIDLNAMEDDPQFEFSYEELDKIADKLISGEQIIDPYNKYNGQPKDIVRQISIRQQFGKMLKNKVKTKEVIATIGRWSYDYCKHLMNVDDDFKIFVSDLGLMLVGLKPELSYEQLDQISDRLIAGEKVKL
ncbi:hypothetical protein KBB68_04285 [Candidatus Babeliales bacterium]|nr:hypothetical protein [Candidatus Babeliales bacterium]